MRTTLAIALLLLAGVATAQSMIPISTYTSTYSYTRTRGFYFQTPIDFTIVGMRVPDEQKHGTQHVAVFRPAALPPAYPTTAYTPPLFYGTGSSANILPCQVSFRKGEWVGILGACGDTTVLHNSYGAGPFQSNVLGAAVTLTRFITQTNLASNQGVNAAYSASTGSIGRVEVYVTSATLIGSGSGQPGTALQFKLSAPADAGLVYQVGSSLGNGPIPIDTRTLGLSPDNLLALSAGGLLPFTFQNYVGVLDQQGTATATLNIPNFPVLKGVRIYNAFLTLRATAPSGVSSISNSFLFTIQ
jgi:hypothetical protein